MKVTPTRSAVAILATSFIGMAVSPNPAAADNSQPVRDVGRAVMPVASMVRRFEEKWEAWGLAFNPTNQELAASSAESDEVHIWQWVSRARIAHTLNIFEGGTPKGIFHGGTLNGLVYSPSGKLLAAGHPPASDNKSLRVWNSDTGAIAGDISEPVGVSLYFGIAFFTDSHLLLRTQKTGQLPGDNFVVSSTESWERLWGLRTSPFQPVTLALSPDGRFVALGGSVRVAADGTKPYLQPQIKIVSFRERQINQSFDVLSSNCEFPFVTWSPDGTHIAVGGRPIFDGSRLTHAAVQILDVSKESIEEYQSSQASHVRALVYTPNGKYLIIGWDKVVEIWNSQRTEKLQSISVEPTAVAVSSDGQYMAVAAIDNSITVWSMR